MPDTGNPSWIVATTHHKREAWAAENAARQGFEIYFPRMIERRKAKNKIHLVASPVFPGYLFVRWRSGWTSLLSTFGVASILLRGESPDLLQDRFVQRLKEREDARGFISLPKLRPGMRVLIKTGILKDHYGLYQGMQAHDRRRILMDVLGRRTEVIVDADAVEIAA